MSDEPSPASASSFRALLKQRDFVLLWLSRWTAVLAVQVESVTLGWQVYDIARRGMDVKRAAFMVSLIGLVSFIPVLLLALPAGETADRHKRKTIMLFCLAGEIASVAVLTAAAAMHFATIPLLLGVAFVFGAARAYFSPASTAVGPMLVPRALLPRAIAWNSLAWQTASVGGPALGGLLVALSPAHSYGTALVLYVVSSGCILLIAQSTQPTVQPGSRWALMKEGLAYVWGNKIVFGSISLDLAAVILGGATALLPVFARDVLHIGPEGFGLLRAGPSIGAAIVALYLASNPIRSKAGIAMFTGVAIFGITSFISWLVLHRWHESAVRREN